MKTHILKLLMRLSSLPVIGGTSLKLACRWVGPYKNRRQLIRLSGKRFVSPYADIYCPSLDVGDEAFIDDDVTIFAHASGGSVILGAGSSLQRGCILETIEGGSIVIGRNTHIQASCNLTAALGSIRIGDNVQLAPRCALYPYQHGFRDLQKPMSQQPITSKGDIVIEDGAWLGVGVVVLDGVTIGAGVVVGAGAVVTASIPPNMIAAGVPARVIGDRRDLSAATR